MERLNYDLLIVGAGIAGLCAALRFKALCPDRSVCVLEKGAFVGAHVLSGAIMDPIALNELLPGWEKEYDFPLTTVKKEKFSFLGEKKAFSLPVSLLPKGLKNEGHYLLSLSQMTRFLEKKASELEIDLFPSFSGANVLYEENRVLGVKTGDLGLTKDGKNENFEEGTEIYAPFTLFAEGSFGTLSQEVISYFSLARETQHYSLGIKEVWEVKHHDEGFIHHLTDPSLEENGAFLYHLPEKKVALGMIVSLSYENPFFSPFGAFQKLKAHPEISSVLEGGKRLSYGAKTLVTGGLNALPKLSFPGGALIGCAAGFMNSAKLKGIHTAIKSALLAADAVSFALAEKKDTLDLEEHFKASWLYDELNEAKNIKAWQKKGPLLGSLMVGIDQLILKGKFSLSLKTPDYATLKEKNGEDQNFHREIEKALALSGTSHRSDQPPHLVIQNQEHFEAISKQFSHPETRFCPAAVYQRNKTLTISFENCLHCKTCAIKDPSQEIKWTLPEGGDGPKYTDL